MEVMGYAGARHTEAAGIQTQEVIEYESAGGDKLTVKRTHFGFLFRDTSVHAATTETQSAPALTYETRLVDSEDVQRYIRNVS